MDWHAYVRATLARHRTDPDDQVVLELAQHARAAWEAERAEGRSSDDAEAHIREQVDAWCRETAHYPRRRRTAAVPPPAATSSSWVTGWTQDVRYGLRLLARQRAFTLAAVVTTAVGIGAVGTLFSVAYGVLMRPLPWPDGGELLRVWETREGGRGTLPTILTNKAYLEWMKAPEAITGLAAWSGSSRVALGDDAAAPRVLSVPVSPNLFSLLGAQPIHGSAFRDTGGELPKEAILSHGLWLERFGGDVNVINRPVTIDGETCRIVGVMPAGFYFPTPEVRLWLPFRVRAVQTAQDGSTQSVSMFSGIARLRPGRTPAQAAAEGTARARGGPPPGLVDFAVFGTKGAAVIHAVPYAAFVAREVRQPLLVFLCAVLLLFLTAVASISSMQLARSTARRRELAVRAALGAGAGRLARQLLVESAILGLTGGAAGLALMAALHAALPWLLPADFPRIADVSMNPRVVAAAAGTAFIAGLAFGVLPALRTRRLNLVATLAEDSLAPVGAGRRAGVGRLRALIMTGQVAIAAVLLVGAALLGRTFIALWHADRGYEPQHVLTATLILPERSFKAPVRAAFMRELLTRLEATAGVTAAGFTSIPPLSNWEALMGFRLPGPNGPIDAQAGPRSVSPGYARAMGIRVVEGRWFTAADTPSSDPVVVVNRTFASTYLQGSAVGQRLPIGWEETGPKSYTIAGVIDDVLPSTRGERPRPEIYASFLQMREGLRIAEPTVVVRTTRDPEGLAPVVRQAIAEIDPRAIVEQLATMEERLRTGLARPRLYAVLLSGFAALALLIAGTGLFGVLAYGVAQRQREIGVRAALGATPAAIVGLVLRQSATMTLTGLAVGLLTAYLSVNWLASFLFGVRARDPISFIIVPIVLLLVAAIASFVPARRAATIDPLRAIRS